MRRRSRAGGKSLDAQPRKAAARKRRIARKATHPRSSSAARKEAKVALLARERDEALEQQRATSELLSLINRSSFDLQMILQNVLETAARLCRAEKSVIFRLEKGVYRFVAACGASSPYVEIERATPILPGPGTVVGRAAMSRRAVRIDDVLIDPLYEKKADARIGGFRSAIGVPLMRENDPIGVLALARSRVDPFTTGEIELTRTFADQAVIAIENARLFEAEQRRTRELTEALEQQTATSEVLQIISSSPGELEPVFDAMLANAARLCEAKFGALGLREGDAYRIVAIHNAPQAFAEFLQREPLRPSPNVTLGRAIATKRVAQTADITIEQPYLQGDPLAVAAVELGGYRTVLAVPMLKESEIIGLIIFVRQEVRPFNDKQIALLQNFANQVVIAIENARLLNELRQRTSELTESLQQQTATSEVLKVISGSPGDLQSIFEAMLDNAVRICDANGGGICRWDGDALRHVAIKQTQPAFAELIRRTPIHPNPKTNIGRMLVTKTVVHVGDIAAQSAYLEQREPEIVATVEVGRIRTLLAVPMLRENELIGAVILHREEVRPFTDKQIELVKNFASQAVIAIENARLLNELRQRTDDLTERTADLTEALAQQTATSEVLKIVSSSPGELEPVFNAMLETATRVCGAQFGVLYRFEDGKFHPTALVNAPPVYADFVEKRGPFVPQAGNALGRVMRTRQTSKSIDESAESTPTASAKLAEARSQFIVPMLKGEELIGAIAIYRQEVRPFTDKQIELVQNFADQAVIAIENTRLLNELRESLLQQTATADVLKVISRSTFDLQAVLDTLVQSAARPVRTQTTPSFSGAKVKTTSGAHTTVSRREFLEYMKSQQLKPERGTAIGRAALDGQIVHIPDVLEDAQYTWWKSQKVGKYKAVLAVPLMREGLPIGVLGLTRLEPRSFSDKQIELLTTFADQAVIAIENVRLFESVEARTRELAKSLDDLRTAQDRLVQTEKLASLGQLTAGIAHEIKNPLNFVNNFSAVSVELIDELREALGGAHLDSKLRAEISEIADTLQGNLDKVVQHGKRADAIVKNMLLHSRHGSGEHRPVDINALVDESLNLAYHGARAEKQGFNITLERSFDPAAGEVDLFPQEITRALLNLISNGFYAATKRKAEANGGDYEPTLAAATKSLGDSVEIRIRDNGTGIPPEVKEKLFSPFFTTKPAGEGTGLGLSISHDIIVKQHGGSIEVDTQPESFTEFRIVLPRAGVSLIKSGERM